MISIKKKKSGAHVSKRAQRRNTESLSILEERKHLLTQKDDFFTQEAYKTLRSNIIFSLTGEEGNKIIQVTSAMVSEGKSITSVNLAISFAQTDRKVLLIDCDLRRPKLASLLSLGANVGLSNVLVDHTLLEQAILPTKVPNLSVMTSGEIPPNPSELLGSKRMTALLEELRQVYHYIILDTPLRHPDGRSGAGADERRRAVCGAGPAFGQGQCAGCHRAAGICQGQNPGLCPERSGF